MILKLTVEELKRIVRSAEYNIKTSTGSCVVLFHPDGSVNQPSISIEKIPFRIAETATVCEI